jgi:predicted dehydrogenase
MSHTAIMVGCGNMAAGWLKALEGPALSGRVEIVALVDIDVAAAEKLKADFGLHEAAVSSDLAAELERLRPDVVFDVAIPAARRDIVLAALRSGCHVLTEKPMATSLAEAGELVEAARRARRVHAVTQNRRFKEGIRRVRALVESGVLGRLTALHCDFFVGAHFGGFRDAMRHVLLLDMAIHTFDAVRYVCGLEPNAVYCLETNPAGSWYADGAAANAVFEFDDDVVVTYRGSWCAEGANTAWDASWRIIGTRGTLIWDGESGFTARVADGDDGFFRPLRDVAVPPPRDAGETLSHASVISGFLDAIEGGRQPETAGEDNIKSLAMVLAAIESAATRRRVVINP